MGFERIETFKELAKEYTGNESLDEIALKCRESATKGWVKVRNNNKRVYDGEQRKEILDENGKIKEIWMYRPLDNYDPKLFSVLYCSLLKAIYFNWNKVHNWVDVDDYLDTIYDCLCQTIRHYSPIVKHKDKEIKCSFKTFATNMISNFSINLINRNTTVSRKRDKEGNVISKKVTYYNIPRSLDEILENPKDYDNYNLPKEEEHTSDLVTELKLKYKKQNDFLTWAFLDLQEDESQLLAIKSLFKNETKFKFSKNTLKKIFIKAKENNIDKDLGFTENANNKRVSFDTLYKKSLLSLQKDIEQSMIC